MKIKSEKFPVLSYFLQCRTCDFSGGISAEISPEKVRYLAKKHVRQTGHSVTIVRGGETEYSPDDV